MRRALVARDKGCVFPGCGRPPAWCHVHHITSWMSGGETSLHNLVLLCPEHHRLVHSSRWEVRMVRGHPEFIPPEWLAPGLAPDRQPWNDPLRQ
jgi:HNH endonuclease